MEISLNWLNDYVDIKNENPKELAAMITRAGVAVEKITKLCDAKGLIVGLIEDVSKHPDSDKLSVCKVNIGTEVLQIVCGAPNVSVNQKVIVSPVGTTLPGDFKIKEVNIRGVASTGMICALEEIGVPKEFLSDEEINGIHVLSDDAVPGENALNYVDFDDVIYGLDLSPNRSDCLSMLGFAYETAAVLGREVNSPEINMNEIDENYKLDLKVSTDNCLYYTARVVKDVVIKESPDFIKARLISAGMRPINNVVDISNYVMLEYGQPLHFFDSEKLNGNIEVRMANADEKTVTLDNKERKLNETDIVIASSNKIIGIAGVMGCSNSEVSDTTKDIVIESAIFNPYNIRYTSIRLDLRSEASIRFEKGLDPNKTIEALNRAASLLEKYAEAKILKNTIVYEKIEKEPIIIDVSTDKVNKVLGTNINNNKIESIFKRLGFSFDLTDNIFNVEVPTRRGDIKISEDLIEEVGRMYGFDNIEGKLPSGLLRNGKMSDLYKTRKEIRRRLESLGFYQMLTFSLVKEKTASMFNDNSLETIKVLMPINSEREVLRKSILPSLLNVVDYNLARNTKDIFVYEVSSVYGKKEDYSEEWKVSGAMLGNYINNILDGSAIETDFYLAKGIVSNLLNYLGLANRYTFDGNDFPKEFHPGMSASIKIGKNIIGYVGRVNPNVKKEEIYVFELSITKIMEQKVRGIKYKEPSKYPFVTRDMAVVLNKDILSGDIIRVISRAAGPLLKEINVFDVYEGEKLEENKKSIAFNMTFMDKNKTLTESEVKEVFDSITSKVCIEFDAKLRD